MCAQRIARVIHGPWLAAEVDSAPTIELQLDNKFHAPTSSGLTRYNSCSDVRSALVAEPHRRFQQDAISHKYLRYARYDVCLCKQFLQ